MTANLEEWGKWALDDTNKLGYQSAWLFIMRNNVQQSSNRLRYCITDAEASVVDAAVAKLARHNLRQWRIICMHFIGHMSSRAIAKRISITDKTKTSRTEVEKELNKAIGFVDALVFEFCQVA